MERKGSKWLNTKKYFCVHPDTAEAFEDYDGTDGSFKKMAEIRKEKIAKGEPYWNTSHDDEMKETIRENERDIEAIERRKKVRRK